MSIENEKTLEIYEEYGKNYLDNTNHRNSEKKKEVDEENKTAILDAFSEFGPEARILEIGAGDGEASLMAKKLGFKAYASDVPDYFLEVISSKDLPYYKFNVLKDDLEGRKFDGVMAFRVFPHFGPEDLEVALNRIYKLLRPGGRLVGSAINFEDKGTRGGWYDFPGKYHIGTERYFYFYKQPEIEAAFKKAGFVLDQMNIRGGDSGKRWFEFILTKPSGVRPEVEEYVKAEVLPQYEKMLGHTIIHINQVISRSLAIAEDLDVDRDMVYVAAAYHDLGRTIDDETHHIESGKLLRKDEKLKEFFSDEQIETMAETVEDHRASLKGDPRSIYGRIVSSADRYMDIDDMLARSYDYSKHLHPDWTDEEIIEEARIHLREKFTPDGYGSKKVYYPTVDDIECFKLVDEYTKDPAEYQKIMKEFNKNR